MGADTRRPCFFDKKQTTKNTTKNKRQEGEERGGSGTKGNGWGEEYKKSSEQL